ncbi:MAG: transposase, partial [Verrucomicrobiota bacterium]
MNTKNTDTIGIDLGDPSHEACTLSKAGEVTATITLLNYRSELEAFSAQNKGAKLILEAGTHSPWISRLFEELGHKVIVANPRKLGAIYKSDNKTDERDAEMLARIGRFDPKLLHAIQHSSLKHERD